MPVSVSAHAVPCSGLRQTVCRNASARVVPSSCFAFFSSTHSVQCRSVVLCGPGARLRSYPCPSGSVQWLRLPFLPSYYIMRRPECQAPGEKNLPGAASAKRTSVLSYSFCLKHSYIRYFSRMKVQSEKAAFSGRKGVFSSKTEQNDPCRSDRNSTVLEIPICL